MADDMTREWVDDWNNKIYRNPDGTPVVGGISGSDFWNEFGIESWPVNKRACASHIPERWADDVEKFIVQVQTELEGRIEFHQIKEKFCRLTVYFGYDNDEDAKNRMYELINECIERLISKGVHPPKTGENNG